MVYIIKEETQRNVCICTALNDTPLQYMQYIDCICTAAHGESVRYDDGGGGNAANGHHFKGNKRIQTKYLLLARLG